MTDPSFETGFSGWSVFGPPSLTFARVQTEPHTGTASLLCSNRTEWWHGASFSLSAPTSSNQTYRVSAWVRLAETATDGGPPPVTSATLGLTVKLKCDEETDAIGSSYDQIGSALVTDSWTFLTGTTLPLRQDCGVIRDYRVFIAGVVAESDQWPDFYIDDVSWTLVEE